jgi:hypothetical protein
MSELALLIPSDDIFAFLQATAAEFLNLPEECEADFTCPGHCGETRIFVVDAPQAVVAFFSEIMENDPQRFTQMNRAFDASHVGYNGPSWAVTRFGGALYLSLALGADIYVRRIPAQMSRGALALARQYEKFLDCTVTSPSIVQDRWAMPSALARTLQ